MINILLSVLLIKVLIFLFHKEAANPSSLRTFFKVTAIVFGIFGGLGLFGAISNFMDASNNDAPAQLFMSIFFGVVAYILFSAYKIMLKTSDNLFNELPHVTTYQKVVRISFAVIGVSVTFLTINMVMLILLVVLAMIYLILIIVTIGTIFKGVGFGEFLAIPLTFFEWEGKIAQVLHIDGGLVFFITGASIILLPTLLAIWIIIHKNALSSNSSDS